MQLVKYEQARKALAAVRNVDEAKTISDKAEALRAYARQAKDTDLENWAAEIKLRAQRRVGEISKKLEKISPQEKGKMAHGVSSHTGVGTKEKVLKKAGINTGIASRCEKIASIPKKEFEEYVNTKKEKHEPVSAKEVVQAIVKDKNKKDRISKINEISENNKALNKGIGTFPVLYADPPWRYEHSKTDSRLIENQYPI